MVLLIGGNGYARGTGVEGSIILFIALSKRTWSIWIHELASMHPLSICKLFHNIRHCHCHQQRQCLNPNAGVSDVEGSIILLLFHLYCLPQYKLGSMKASHCLSFVRSWYQLVLLYNSTFIKLKYHFRCGALLAAMFYPVSPSRGTALRRLRRGSRSLTSQHKYFSKAIFLGDKRVPTNPSCSILFI